MSSDFEIIFHGATVPSSLSPSGPAGAANDLVIHAKTVALESFPNDSPYRPTLLLDLAKAFVNRFNKTKSTADLDRAIQTTRSALVPTSADDPERAPRLNYLGTVLRYRFNAAKSLDEWIAANEEALEHTHPSHPIFPMCLIDLAEALRTRFKCTRVRADLRRSIAICDEHLPSVPYGLNREMLQIALAIGIHDLMDDLGTDIDQMESYTQATSSPAIGSDSRLIVDLFSLGYAWRAITL
jgi:hypothetical protein